MHCLNGASCHGHNQVSFLLQAIALLSLHNHWPRHYCIPSFSSPTLAKCKSWRVSLVNLLTIPVCFNSSYKVSALQFVPINLLLKCMPISTIWRDIPFRMLESRLQYENYTASSDWTSDWHLIMHYHEVWVTKCSKLSHETYQYQMFPKYITWTLSISMSNTPSFSWHKILNHIQH